MFKWLKKYDKILVTGPHRSGTTITARMIAADTGFRFLDEKEIRHRLIREIPKVWQTKSVLQAPNAFPWLPAIVPANAAVIVMNRLLADIAASVSKLTDSEGRRVAAPAFTAQQGYALWHQVKRLPPWQTFHWFEVCYDTLQGHPLWVPKARREGWHHKQCREEG